MIFTTLYMDTRDKYIIHIKTVYLLLAKQMTEYLEFSADPVKLLLSSTSLPSDRRWRRFLSGRSSSDMADMEVMEVLGETEGGGVRVPMEPAGVP